MARARRVRWECPAGEHPAVLGSTRPPRDSVVRYCWPCSQESGRLVERVAPSLERKREERKATAAARKVAEREREREKQLVPVVDFDGEVVRLDAKAMLAKAWGTEELRCRRGESWSRGSWGRRPPRLVVRRSKGRPAHTRGAEIRAGGDLSGHAKAGGEEIVLSCGPGLSREWLEAIIVHEAAHAACAWGVHHGSEWASSYVRTIRELYGVRVQVVRPAWRLDDHVAEALRAR